MKRFVSGIAVLAVFVLFASPVFAFRNTAVNDLATRLAAQQGPTVATLTPGAWKIAYDPTVGPVLADPEDTTWDFSGIIGRGQVAAYNYFSTGPGVGSTATTPGGILPVAATFATSAESAWENAWVNNSFVDGGAPPPLHGITPFDHLLGQELAAAGLSTGSASSSERTSELARFGGSFGTDGDTVGAVAASMRAYYEGIFGTSGESLAAWNMGHAAKALFDGADFVLQDSGGTSWMTTTPTTHGLAAAIISELDSAYGGPATGAGDLFDGDADPLVLLGLSGMVLGYSALGMDPSLGNLDYLGELLALQVSGTGTFFDGFFDGSSAGGVGDFLEGTSYAVMALREYLDAGFSGVGGAMATAGGQLTKYIEGVHGAQVSSGNTMFSTPGAGFVEFDGVDYFEFPQIDGAGLSAIVASVPEPATWALFMLGLGGTGLYVRRQRKKKVRA